MIKMTEEIQMALLLKPQADGSLTSDYVSLRNAKRDVYVKVVMAQATTDQCTITLGQAQDVAGTGAKALSGNAEIWSNEDLVSSDLISRSSTPAKSFQFSAVAGVKVVWFKIPVGSCFDQDNNFDCLYLTSGGSDATNILSAECLIEPRSSKQQSMIAEAS